MRDLQGLQPLLCQLVWQALEAAADNAPTPPLPEPLPLLLAKPGACFVTLTRNGELRGCIGSLEASRPLADDLQANAHAAATRDPRFPAVQANELDHLQVSISVLGERIALQPGDRQAIIAQLTVGEDGLVISYGERRATFLPSVWEHLATADAFLTQLRIKAGISPSVPDDALSCQRYRVQELNCRTRSIHRQ